jgi:hypothetical protein
VHGVDVSFERRIDFFPAVALMKILRRKFRKVKTSSFWDRKHSIYVFMPEAKLVFDSI